MDAMPHSGADFTQTEEKSYALATIDTNASMHLIIEEDMACCPHVFMVTAGRQPQTGESAERPLLGYFPQKLTGFIGSCCPRCCYRSERTHRRTGMPRQRGLAKSCLWED